MSVTTDTYILVESDNGCLNLCQDFLLKNIKLVQYIPNEINIAAPIAPNDPSSSDKADDTNNNAIKEISTLVDSDMEMSDEFDSFLHF